MSVSKVVGHGAGGVSSCSLWRTCTARATAIFLVGILGGCVFLPRRGTSRALHPATSCRAPRPSTTSRAPSAKTCPFESQWTTACHDLSFDIALPLLLLYSSFPAQSSRHASTLIFHLCDNNGAAAIPFPHQRARVASPGNGEGQGAQAACGSRKVRTPGDAAVQLQYERLRDDRLCSCAKIVSKVCAGC